MNEFEQKTKPAATTTYRKLYEKNAALLNGKPWLKKSVLIYNQYASLFFFAAYFFLLAFEVFSDAFTPKTLAPVFFLPALALLLVSALQLGVHRARPYEGENGITPLRKKGSKQNSFPSRHLCSAAVIACVFLPALPIVGGVLLLLAAGLGYARFSVGWHYPSDLVAGFLLGTLVGCCIFLF